MSTTGFGGPIGPVSLTNGTYTFLGGTTLVDAALGQRLTGSATASVGRSSGTADLAVNLCFQPQAGGTLLAMGPQPYVDVTGARQAVAVSGTVTPGTAGPWIVGFCATKSGIGTVSIDANDYSSGWVMVTN